MKAFISVDLEGMPYVVILGQLNIKGSLYEEARKIATEITLIVAEELHKNGFEKIIIADSHGPMVNLLIEDLPEYVEIVRGSLRPTSMVAGSEGCDVALFLGYHSKFGTVNSTFDHTYSGGSVHKLEINGVEVSEYLLNSYTVGDSGIPIIFMAGDKQLIEDDVKTLTPWVESVALKESISRLSAKSPSMKVIEKDIRSAVNKAVINVSENKVKPLITDKPVRVKLTLRDTHQTDAITYLPFITRLDALTVEFTSSNMVEAYKTFQALMFISAGVTNMMRSLS
ncbi:MAG: M55 family metallopeptidase [Candidatus Heimdallarchaeota archaeon]|nr:peptide transporter [Candidatus Heimdallarchaeota archaeon]MCG3254575.1 M55 family metallopeptidase [Candidatus Heimdallarchaeota archaeon]MCK4609659.1 M55 family metallopeptidase [Candidatus Heimdallarchaeota archaeon]